MSSFYENFVELCKRHSTTPTAVAINLGLANSICVRWKKGSVPRGETIKNIADYFNVSVDYLLGADNKETDEIVNQILNNKVGVRVPVYGSVSAGIPLEAITDIEDWEEISSEMASKGEYFALKIRGNSMEPRICNGDVVIVRRQEDAETGDIVIVMINGSDATCKRIKKTPEGVELIPLNEAYKPMAFTNQQVEELPVRVIGKVVESRTKF